VFLENTIWYTILHSFLEIFHKKRMFCKHLLTLISLQACDFMWTFCVQLVE